MSPKTLSSNRFTRNLAQRSQARKNGSRLNPRISRRTIFLITAGLLLVLFEAGGWIYDARAHFRFQLLRALDTMQRVNTPIPAQPDSRLNWPAGAVFVRDWSYAPPPGNPYVIGGKTIPEARADARQLLLGPGPNDKRPKVFILGESAAFGFPLAYPDTFAARITPKMNELGVGVLDAAEPAWPSGMLVPVAERVIDLFHPKVLILYMGNNEWIHWLPENEAPSPRVLAAFRAFSISRAIAYMEYRAIKKMVDKSHSPEGAFVSHQELTGYKYALDHPLNEAPPNWEECKKAFLSNFESNLLQVIYKAKAENTRVILLTVPFCYRLSPAWKHPQPLAYTEQNRMFVAGTVKEAAAALERKDSAAALDKLSAAIAREPRVPILHYLRASALEMAGRTLEAENAYSQCREAMIGNLGSIHSINQVISRVAASTGADLIDVKGSFDAYEHRLGRCCNDDLILDDCHPTPLGHQLISQELLPVLLRKE